MKKLFILCLMVVPFAIQAQEYRKFFFGIDLGCPLGKNSGIGSFTLEPALRLNDKMSIGLRMEATGFITLIGADNISMGSIGLSYQYYLPIKSSRLFVGGGLAIFNPTNTSPDILRQRNAFGLFPRIGVDLGPFRIMVEYNIVDKMRDYVTLSPPPNPIGEYRLLNKDYLNLKMGFTIGGGKRKK